MKIKNAYLANNKEITLYYDNDEIINKEIMGFLKTHSGSIYANCYVIPTELFAGTKGTNITTFLNPKPQRMIVSINSEIIEKKAFIYSKIDHAILNVREIGNNAFQESSISFLTLGSGLTSIGRKAFAYLSGTMTTTINLTENIKAIGSNAFCFSRFNHMEIEGAVIKAHSLAHLTVSMLSFSESTKKQVIPKNGISFMGSPLYITLNNTNLVLKKGSIVINESAKGYLTSSDPTIISVINFMKLEDGAITVISKRSLDEIIRFVDIDEKNVTGCENYLSYITPDNC